MNSIQSQVDRGIDEVIKYLDDEFQNWDTKVNETVQKEMNDAQIDKIIDLSKFVLNVMKNFFRPNVNKTQILDHLNSITSDLKNVKSSVNRIDSEAKNAQQNLACHNIPKCSNTISKLLNLVNDFNEAIKTYDSISETAKRVENISDDSQIPDLEKFIADKSPSNLYDTYNLTDKIQDYQKKPREAAKFLKENVTSTFNWTSNFNETVQEGLDGLSYFVSEYGPLVYRTFLAASIVIALILLLSTLGLIFGKQS